jgi:hypothetical protein
MARPPLCCLMTSRANGSKRVARRLFVLPREQKMLDNLNAWRRGRVAEGGGLLNQRGAPTQAHTAPHLGSGTPQKPLVFLHLLAYVTPHRPTGHNVPAALPEVYPSGGGA